MTKYRSEATYRRRNLKTNMIESTYRLIEVYASSKAEAEVILLSQMRLDNVVGHAKIVTKVVK